MKLYDDDNDTNQNMIKRIENKVTIKPVIQYTNNSYFGDADIFAKNSGRDLTAITSDDSTIFIMGLDTLSKIKVHFDEIYEQMEDLGIKRYKYH